MLSINTIARVVVNTVRASASPSSFDTGLLLVQENPFSVSDRLHSYGSAAEAVAGLTEIARGSGVTPGLETLFHKTVKKVSSDIEEMN